VTVDFDFGTGVLSKKDFVTDFYFEGLTGAFVIETASSDSQDFALLRLLFSGIGKDDATRCFLFGLEFLDNNAVRPAV
jgi:hypothetical protein